MKKVLGINQQLSSGSHPQNTNGPQGYFLSDFSRFLPKGAGLNITFVHGNQTQGPDPGDV